MMPIIILLIIVSAIFGLNFEPATWLSGWDNLHPEFNFSLNLSRSFFGVWQEYQGLGLLGGMGHSSDFFRQIFLWLSSIILPDQLIRYFYHFLMLLIGSIGVYYLLESKLLIQFEKSKRLIPTLAGALFYIFNLGTLQMFYVPFEAYSAHFAFLPWLFYSVINFLDEKNKKSFLFFLLINLLAVSQGYVATVFVVYFGLLTVFLLFQLVFSKKSLNSVAIIFITSLLINAFWLLPNIYFLIQNVDANLFSKINEMATEDNLLKNLRYGNFANTALLKGFLFDSYEFNKEGNSVSIFLDWYKYTKTFPFLFFGYFFFFSILLGIFLAIKKRLIVFWPFILFFIIGFILLSNNTFGFSLVDNLIYKLPLFSQIFRFPFTKFIIFLAFSFSIFYSLFSFQILDKFNNKFIRILIGVILCVLPLIYLFPIFQGKFFYGKEKSNIPQEYFQVFDFFKKQDTSTRIANLPQNSYWGWEFYRWDYSGSGFIWYGIKQPILDRAFDVWNSQNENYYWEISYAIYSKNQQLLENVLEKYQINWLLVDGNIINPSSPKALYLNELDDLIYSSFKIKNVATYGNIKIYKVDLENKTKDFVFLNNNLPNIQPTYQWNNNDQAFIDNGNYLSINHKSSIINHSINYPFRSLFTGKRQEDQEFNIQENESEIIFEKEIPQGYQLIIPETVDELFWINSQNLGEQKIYKPQAYIENNELKVKFPKINGYFYGDFLPSQIISKSNPQNCNQFTNGTIQNQAIDNYWLRLGAIDANNCSASFWFPNLAQSLSYLIKVDSRNQEGKSLIFWLENLNSQKADIETYLPRRSFGVGENASSQTSYFVQPPMTSDGLGYTLHFDNISIGNQKTINDLGRVTIYQIPWKFLTSLKLVTNTDAIVNVNQLPNKVFHPNPSFYEINLEKDFKGTLVLSQSYHDGWQGFEMINDQWSMINRRLGGILTPVIGKKINSHVLVNNWENGWQIENSENIALIFWPQYLEYFGFILLGFIVLYVIVLITIKKND